MLLLLTGPECARLFQAPVPGPLGRVREAQGQQGGVTLFASLSKRVVLLVGASAGELGQRVLNHRHQGQHPPPRTTRETAVPEIGAPQTGTDAVLSPGPSLHTPLSWQRRRCPAPGDLASSKDEARHDGSSVICSMNGWRREGVSD